jgi:hypothetical protein
LAGASDAVHWMRGSNHHAAPVKVSAKVTHLTVPSQRGDILRESHTQVVLAEARNELEKPTLE